MDLGSNEIGVSKLDLTNSKAKRVYDIFLANPDRVFDIREMIKTYKGLYQDKANNYTISTIITRLFAKNKLIRTPTQLNSGYFYSVANKRWLDKIYNDYLVPAELKDKDLIKKLILKNQFDKLRTDNKLDLNRLKYFDFIKKYGLSYFYEPKVMNFLAANVAFLMGDGHIRKDFEQVEYTFNQEKDAISFKSFFNSVFPNEYLSLKYSAYCFRVGLCSQGFSKLFNHLGVPTGKKVFQPFLVPDWIYYGSDEIKKAFLSMIYGNEGSKPQDNKWRIQFVLSKSKEHVFNLLEFLNQIRAMLAYLGISTSHVQLRKQKGREFHGRFYIKGKEDLLKFYNKVGFAYASEKQEVLEALLRKGKLIN